METGSMPSFSPEPSIGVSSLNEVLLCCSESLPGD
jgi:hypothetical protein